MLTIVKVVDNMDVAANKARRIGCMIMINKDCVNAIYIQLYLTII